MSHSYQVSYWLFCNSIKLKYIFIISNLTNMSTLQKLFLFKLFFFFIPKYNARIKHSMVIIFSDFSDWYQDHEWNSPVNLFH